jgi:hypothetical protein
MLMQGFLEFGKDGKGFLGVSSFWGRGSLDLHVIFESVELSS